MFDYYRHTHTLLLAILKGNIFIMSQMDELLAGLSALASDVDNLETQLTQLQQTANVPPENLQPALDAVASLRSRIEGTQAAAQAQPQPSDTTQQSSGTDGAAAGDPPTE